MHVNFYDFLIRSEVSYGHRSKVLWPTPEVIGDQKSCIKPYFGAHGDEEIPVLIPNTEVKLVSGDYTAKSGKLARCRIFKKTSERRFFCKFDILPFHFWQ